MLSGLGVRGSNDDNLLFDGRNVLFPLQVKQPPLSAPSPIPGGDRDLAAGFKSDIRLHQSP